MAFFFSFPHVVTQELIMCKILGIVIFPHLFPERSWGIVKQTSFFTQKLSVDDIFIRIVTFERHKWSLGKTT